MQCCLLCCQLLVIMQVKIFKIKIEIMKEIERLKEIDKALKDGLYDNEIKLRVQKVREYNNKLESELERILFADIKEK